MAGEPSFSEYPRDTDPRTRAASKLGSTSPRAERKTEVVSTAEAKERSEGRTREEEEG